jgi:hypothetical protein
MSKWKAVDPALAAMAQQAEERRSKKQKKPVQGRPNFIVGFVDHTAPPPIDYNFECGCFGTEHDVINNCLNCGRIICTREGERPCPYCGELVLSNETLEDPDRCIEVIERIHEKIGANKWRPVRERQLVPALDSPEISTKMIDLERDWFAAELSEIFGASAVDS